MPIQRRQQRVNPQSVFLQNLAKGFQAELDKAKEKKETTEKETQEEKKYRSRKRYDTDLDIEKSKAKIKEKALHKKDKDPAELERENAKSSLYWVNSLYGDASDEDKIIAYNRRMQALQQKGAALTPEDDEFFKQELAKIGMVAKETVEESVEEVPEGYTEEQIEATMKKYNKSRGEIIQALKKKGK